MTNKSKSWFFEKINNINKPLNRLMKKRREWTQIKTISNKRGESIDDTTDIQKFVRNYYEQLCAKKYKN